MNEQRARELLAEYVQPDGVSLYLLGKYLAWAPSDGDGLLGTEGATLDGRFSPDQLEAVAWWMNRHLKGVPYTTDTALMLAQTVADLWHEQLHGDGTIYETTPQLRDALTQLSGELAMRPKAPQP